MSEFASLTSTSNTGNADADIHAVVSRLIVYPIKSCAGVEVKESILTETGLEFDRAWMVVDEAGEFLNQRELPRMALIRPQLRHDDMVLRAPGMLALHIALNEVEQPTRACLWGETCAAFDMGSLAAQWFSDFLGQRVRLVRFDPDEKRLSSLTWTDGIKARTQFSDGFPLLLVSEASLDGLNAKLTAAGSVAVSMLRFRPNIVIADGPGLRFLDGLLPHDEDRFSELRIQTEQGPVLLKPVKPCPRCPIPNVDPATALVNTDVSDMLQSYRQDVRLEGALSFGMNLIALDGGEHVDRLLKVGQLVAASYRFE